MTDADLQALTEFRSRFYQCLPRRPDAQFELCDALLCADGPVSTLVGLSLTPEHRRGYGALYDGLNQGRCDMDRLRRELLSLPLPRDGEGRIVLAIDVSNWLRPDAPTSAERLFCHTYARGKGAAQMIPGWPYSFIAAVEPGRTSWTRILHGRRLRPNEDQTTTSAAQLREVVEGIIDAGQWSRDDPPILILLDAGYDIARLSWLLADLPVTLIGRLRSDRVLRFDPAAEQASTGRPARHGPEFKLTDHTTWPAPQTMTATATTRYGAATAASWNRLHPRLTHRGAWAEHQGQLPLIAGTLIHLTVEHLPGDQTPKPLWLWTSDTNLDPAQVDRYWQAYLRRFDLEHTFRFLKQTLGWTAPHVHSAATADRWTWIIIAAHTQLGLARAQTRDLRRPWEKPVPPEKLSPARTRRGFRNLHRKLPPQAGAPKRSRPGPGRPPGQKNRHPATIYPVGKHRHEVK